MIGKGRVITERLTNNNRAGQLTNQSRLGSGFRQKVKRGAAAGSVRETKTFLNIKVYTHVTVEAQNTNMNIIGGSRNKYCHRNGHNASVSGDRLTC